MNGRRLGTVRVAGAALFYRVRGNGPLLLILSGGDGDADTTDALCDQLLDRYTVVTYDRRGLSRSTIDADVGDVQIATHREDVHHLLVALSHEPAFVFGSSIGALIGLDLVAQHPEQVRREGADAAFRKFVALAAVDFRDHEPDAVLAPPTSERAANLAFFFTYDSPAVLRYRIDVAALKASPTRIVPAGGQSAPDSAPHRAAAALAAKLGEPLVAFPGGHTSWLLRPKGFASTLREILG